MSSVVPQATSYIIPARPEVLIQLTEELRLKEPDQSKLTQLIKQDVALFTSVIATVNSAYYARSVEITSVERAISILGVKRIFNIVQLAALRNSLSAIGPLERFWDTATDVAKVSAKLSKKLAKLNQDDAYTLGMLHDCGIPLMLQSNSDFKDFLRSMNGRSLAEIHNRELERYGISHYNLCAELAKKWNINNNMAEAISRQPVYEATFTEAADENEQMRFSLCLLMLARDISDIYRHFWRIPDTKEPLVKLEPMLNFLGISDYEYADIKEDILHELSFEQ